MSFIVELTISRIHDMLRLTKFVETDANNVKLGTYFGTWYSENIGANFVSKSQILVE